MGRKLHFEVGFLFFFLLFFLSFLFFLVLLVPQVLVFDEHRLFRRLLGGKDDPAIQPALYKSQPFFCLSQTLIQEALPNFRLEGIQLGLPVLLSEEIEEGGRRQVGGKRSEPRPRRKDQIRDKIEWGEGLGGVA